MKRIVFHRCPGRPPAPDFVVIGAMKCATSTLHTQLAGQPGVFMSNPKEPCFFSDPAIWQQGEEWYDALFRGAPEESLRGESSTHYTKLPDLPDAPQRLYLRRPDARLIYVVRDPLERVISHYIHDWTQRKCRGSLSDALKRHPPLINYGLYAMQLRPWLELFGPAQVLLVPFEGIRIRPQFELQRIADFLGITHPVSWDGHVKACNVSMERLRASWLRDCLVKPAPLAWLRRALIPEPVRERVKSLWRMHRRPALSPEQRVELSAIFNEDLAELGQWIGRPVRCGNMDSQLLGDPLTWTKAAPGQRASSLLPDTFRDRRITQL